MYMVNTNNQTRRDFMKKSAGLLSVLPAWLGAGTMISACEKTNSDNKATPVKSNAATSGLAIRKNIGDLKADDPEIKLFKDAVAILKKRSEIMPLDPAGWSAQGSLHTLFCASSIYVNQVHYSWYVWPWHRLYLWSMEQKLQKAVGESKLALHYWDWTKTGYIPNHYWGDETNPLNNLTREVAATDKIPEDFINVGAAFRAKKYHTFGGYPAILKKGENQRDGIAEQTFHNNIHNWIGGQMATFTESGFDPIFYAHHGNCDRIWEAWRQYHPENKYPEAELWLNKKLYSTDGNGRPVEFKISELLDTKQLGYSFENTDFNPVFCNPYELANSPQRTQSGADCIMPLTVDNTASQDIYKEWHQKERRHIMLHFERAQLPYHPYCARVFFEFTADGKKQSIYTGTFTILPILDMDTFLLQNGVYLQIEVPAEVVQAIHAKAAIQVVMQPVPLPNRKIPETPLRIADIKLFTDA
jgi:Common central domain of tyrosinase/Polyphenol oxidase middle domain